MLAIATPITAPNSYSAAGFGIALTPLDGSPAHHSEYAPTALISNPNPLDAIVPTAPPAIVNGIVTIPAPEGRKIRTLTIAGQIYTYTLTSPPPAGQFTDLGGQLLIGYLGLVPPPVISYYLSPITIPTDRVKSPFPDLLTQFPIQGELSWTLNWEEQPSASFEFITLAAKKAELITYFTTAHNIDIYGVGFATSGQLSITEISLAKSAIPLIKVSVNLTGSHARFLDIYTFLGQQLILLNCASAPTPTLNTPTSMTIQDLAAKVGSSIIGTAIAIDRNILSAPAVATTLGSNLDSNSIRGVGAFIDYNNVGGIVLKQYGSVMQHTVDEEDIRSDIQISINRKIGTSFYKTYDPLTKVNFGANPYTPPTLRAKPTWQPVPLISTETFEGDPNPEISPYAGGTDLSIVFDLSGKRKRRKDIKLINGQPIQEKEQEWGYVGVGNATAGGWQQIESKTTDYTYNDKGYLISVVASGTKKVRYKVENPQKPESLSATGAKLLAYQFFDIPISGSETYELEPMSGYYSDIVAPKVNWTICLPDGSGTLDIPVIDKSYIPPYFVKTKRVVGSGTASAPNPDSTDAKPLPNLTTGKSSEFVERVVVQPKETLSIKAPKDPTYYTKSTDNYNAEGAQFGTVLSIAESSIINGRPPVATNRGAILAIVGGETTTTTIIGANLNAVPVGPPVNPKVPTTTPKPFAIKSGLSNENLGYVTVGSINFPTATNQQQALDAAKLDINIINVKNSQTESMVVNFRPTIRPGDILQYRIGDGNARLRRVISVTNKIKIEGMIDGYNTLVTSAGTEVKLGVESAQVPVITVNLPVRTTTISL